MYAIPLTLSFLQMLASAPFSGLQVGGSVGLATNTGHFSTDKQVVEYQGTSAPFLEHGNTTASKLYQNQLLGELYLGYGLTFCHCAHVGLRGGVSFNDYRFKIDQNTFTPRDEDASNQFVLSQDSTEVIKLNKQEYFVDAKAGLVLFDDLMLFGTVGVSFNKPQYVLETVGRLEVYDESEIRDNLVALYKDRDEKSRYNLRWGIGVEKLFCGVLGVQLMYTYTNYGTIDSEKLATERIFNDVEISQEVNTKTTLKKQSLTCSFNYYF